MAKVLLVWEVVPEQTKLFVFEEGTELCDLALRSAGKYINQDDVEDGDPIDLLNDALESLSPDGDGNTVLEGPFSKVVVCGFIM